MPPIRVKICGRCHEVRYNLKSSIIWWDLFTNIKLSPWYCSYFYNYLSKWHFHFTGASLYKIVLDHLIFFSLYMKSILMEKSHYVSLFNCRFYLGNYKWNAVRNLIRSVVINFCVCIVVFNYKKELWVKKKDLISR